MGPGLWPGCWPAWRAWRRRTSPSALLGLRGNPVTDVAELVIRLTPGQVAEAADPGRRPQGQAAARDRRPGRRAAAVRGLRAAGSGGRRAPAWPVHRARRRRARRQPVAVPGARRRASCRSWSACSPGLAVLALLTAPLRERPFGETDPQPPVPAGRRGVGAGSVVLGLVGWKAGGHRRAVATGAGHSQADGCDRPGRRRPGRRSGSTGSSVADPGQPVLPDRHLPQPAGDRPRGLVAAHPRPGRPPDDRHLRRPARAASDPALAHPQLRLQPRRRRPDQQRLVERRTPQGPARPRPACSRAPTRVKQTSDDGWTCGTPLSALTDDRAGDAGVRDERPAPADRARLPGAHGRAGALRLRVGVQVGHRHGGDDVRLVHGVLDRARLVGAGPGQARLPDRRPARRSPRSSRAA